MKSFQDDIVIMQTSGTVSKPVVRAEVGCDSIHKKGRLSEAKATEKTECGREVG